MKIVTQTSNSKNGPGLRPVEQHMSVKKLLNKTMTKNNQVVNSTYKAAVKKPAHSNKFKSMPP
jgi:hypothetical protein